MNIESSHKFNRSGDTAHGCIEGVNLTQSQVGVIGAMPISAVTSKTGRYFINNTIKLMMIVYIM